MKIGDLVRKVEGEMDYGMTGVILEFSETIARLHQETLVIVLAFSGTKWWSINEVEVINENR